MWKIPFAKDPLFHFLLLGLAILSLDRVLHPGRGPAQDDDRRIHISRDVLLGLRADHQRRFGAPPTQAEEDALLSRYVDSEVLYRQALSRGLLKGDVIVRRRMQQKMELLLEGPDVEPDEAALLRHFQAHKDAYRGPAGDRAFSEVRAAVRQDVLSEQRERSRRESLAALRTRYEVRMEGRP